MGEGESREGKNKRPVAILAQAIWSEIVVKQCDFQREHFVFVSFPAFWP